ncbi:hypothetical protein Tco_0193767, partial [Tanacetum coccineum]
DEDWWWSVGAGISKWMDRGVIPSFNFLIIESIDNDG